MCRLPVVFPKAAGAAGRVDRLAKREVLQLLTQSKIKYSLTTRRLDGSVLSTLCRARFSNLAVRYSFLTS